MLRNTIDPESGLSIASTRTRKRISTMQAKIDPETGLNACQTAALKGIAVLKNKINPETGLSAWEEKHNKHASWYAENFANLILQDATDTHESYLYVVHDTEADLIKIGWTTNPDQRIGHISESLGKNKQLTTRAIVKAAYSNIVRLETALHRKHKCNNVLRESGIQGRTEWFKSIIIDEVLEELDHICASDLSHSYHIRN